MRCTLRLMLCMASMLLLSGTTAAITTPVSRARVFPVSRIAPDTSVDLVSPTLPGHYSKSQHKRSLKQKVVLKLVKWKASKFLGKNGEPTPRQKRLGKLSLIFGIAAFAVVLVPFLNILAVPSALTAIILGIISLKGNSNTNGIIGLSLGGLFYLLLFLLVVILIVAFSGW